MDTKRLMPSRLTVMRTLLALASVALLLWLTPRADHQSFSYELNQPWKYPLLTAEFDMPIMRDSASARVMRDSIDAKFVPFVERKAEVAEQVRARLDKALAEHDAAGERQRVLALVAAAYSRGILTPELYDRLHTRGLTTVRVNVSEGNDRDLATVDASRMLSPAKAFEMIDSAYQSAGWGRLDPPMVRALNICLLPNIILDSISDQKFRNQENLSVNAALGVIKKGQRIVDRGEIITPQIFTNLNTYQEILERNQSTGNSRTYFLIAQALYILICITVLYLYLHLYRPAFFGSLRKMTFLMTFITLFVAFSIEMFEFFPAGLYLVPFASVPIVIMVFFDSRTAIFSLLTAVMVTALVATFPFQFIFMEMMVGLCATFSIHQLTRRSQLLRTALVTFAGYVVCYLTLTLLTEGNLHSFSWKIIGTFGINCVVLSFAYILIVVVEKIFGFTSSVTLVELSDINNPLLRRMAEVAPGTFQHSMQVSTLAAEAARAIGANTQLARTGALYHDIGKMESPVFFTENQHGVNPHAGLDPETSAQKIISHVTDGLALASRHKLPTVIRDFISQHHGKGVTRYFYNTAVNNAPEGEEVDISRFRYPGPNPQTKETAILMMADAVEAASRSLKEYTPEAIDGLVDRIIDTQSREGLFKESPISYSDVETVKNTFKKRLGTIYHSRIAYPELKKH
ncbi:MAG: HDIG domain-containing protein [Muribaculaceae bacterium]|nr:HDIG domain-containing protein [Muribaculaceae bacterium]